MNSRESFNHVSTWLADARSLASPDIVVVLVGNKVDKDEEREVQFIEASRFAQENGKSQRIEILERLLTFFCL